MLTLYLKATPVAPVFLILYDPARSTKKNLAVVSPPSLFYSPIYYNLTTLCFSILIINIA
jgi:hypothetical protein